MSRVALVTGGTRGIGLGIARELAAGGFDVILCGRRPASEIEPVLAELSAGGQRASYLRADIGSAQDRAELLVGIRETVGAVNVLVNNAGVAPSQRRDLLEATEDSFDRLISINLKGPYFLTQAIVRDMVDARSADPTFPGTVVFVTSVSATLASPERGEYCVSKAGLSMAAQLWAARLAQIGIPVYEVRPGVIRTDMTSGVTTKYDRLIAEGLVPQHRWGEPEDVGRAVAALARGDFPYSTGQVVMVDGGLTLGRL
ncbi:MAG: 3-ketoacyl-ACP reductase [Dactylosporangium sp.]|nr:3-ketoacyl-ACP reductase [Dactylosporangium sp.]NNJ61490.1 3-ketoacyl-ACP reductase [Dactylosporangium sp.]